jgi:hypothetical protein
MYPPSTKAWLKSRLKFNTPAEEKRFFSHGAGAMMANYMGEYHREAISAKLQTKAFNKRVIQVMRVIYPDIPPSRILTEKSEQYEAIRLIFFNFFSRSHNTINATNIEPNGTQ